MPADHRLRRHRDEEREHDGDTARPSRGPAPHPLLALQQSAGNQAVGRMLNRSVKVGLPGPSNPQTEYGQPADVALLTAALGAKLATMPAWVGVLVAAKLPALVTGNALYEFDADGDVVDWIVLQAVADKLLAFARSPMPGGAADARIGTSGQDLKAAYAEIETLRAAYQAAGDAAQTAPGGRSPFPVFGLTYELQYSGPGHYYASRNGHTVLYSTDFKRSHATSLLNHLRWSGRDAAFSGKPEHVDNFVCSFLAEPSRWPTEQVFNLLATQKTGEDGTSMVSSDAKGTLPMAAGTTWNAELQQLGRQLPKRALEHARSEGLADTLTHYLTGSQNLAHLVNRVAGSLDLINRD